MTDPTAWAVEVARQKAIVVQAAQDALDAANAWEPDSITVSLLDPAVVVEVTPDGS